MKKVSNIVLRILGIFLLIPSAWEEKAPDLDIILGKIAKNKEKSRFLALTNKLVYSS